MNSEEKINNTDKEKRRMRIIIVILILITVIAVLVSIWAIFFRKPAEPDYPPLEAESDVTPIGDDDDSKMDAPEGGGAVSLTYTRDVSIDLSDKKVTLMFANPSKSTQDMVLQLVVQDRVLMESGKLLPGYRVTKLDLLKDMEKLLKVGRYEGKFVVLYYDQQSNEKAMVNTEIPVVITVQE